MAQQFPEFDVDVSLLSASDLKQRLDDGDAVTVLDTRRPADFEQWTISHRNARLVNVPFTDFLESDGDPVSTVPEGVPGGPLVTCCAKGISSLFVAEFLAAAGYEVEALAEGMEGWARLYDRTVLAAEDDTTLYQYHRPSSGCLAYLLVAGDEAAVFDPLRAFTDRYVADCEAAGATLRYAIDTHVHADHVSGIRELAVELDATPVVPAGAVDRGFEHPDFRAVVDGEQLGVGDRTITAVHLPGHTSELTGFDLDVGDVVLTADALFVDGVGRPDLERGEDGARDAAGRLYETLAAIDRRPDSTLIAPGHAGPDTRPQENGAYAARLGVLRERIPAFTLDRATFVDRTATGLPPRPNNYERIIATNLGQASVDDVEAFELELGPNNCAAPATSD